MTDHHLRASPDTCHWGYFDSRQKPVLTIRSSDSVRIDTVSGQPEYMPDPRRFRVAPELAAIHALSLRGAGPHILTGPIAVDGAKPGHVLEVRIRATELAEDWGYNIIRPQTGALPDDFDAPRVDHDRSSKIATLPWGSS